MCTCIFEMMSVSFVSPPHDLGFLLHDDVGQTVISLSNSKGWTCDWDEITRIICRKLVRKSLTRQGRGRVDKTNMNL